MNAAKSTKIALTVLGFLAFASTVRAETTFSGSHTVLTTSVDNPVVMENVVRLAEETALSARAFFAGLGLPSSNELSLSIKVYGDHQQMLRETPPNAAKEISMLGYFSHQSREIGVWYGGNTEEMERIVRHETIHHVLHQIMPNIDATLDEGLAEFLSRDPAALKNNRASELPYTLKVVMDSAKAAGQMTKIDELFALNFRDFYGAKQDIHYVASYATLAYVLNTQGPRVLGNFITAVQAGEKPSRWVSTKTSLSAEAFEKSILGWASL